MEKRPKAIHVSRSFSRMESAPVSPARKRASTLQESGIPAVPEACEVDGSTDSSGKLALADVFENPLDDGGDEGSQMGTDMSGPDLQTPSTFDELPIEIKSLTERFLESLSAKVHPQPLTADALSNLFQDFYDRAASHIATHIATLSSRIGREKSPALSKGSTKSRSRAGSGSKRADTSSSTGGEMLTATEVADRRKARRLLEIKRVALEEAAERVVTERVYDRIWKHRSTDDDARDEKLRSRTAALSLVGIGLKELHMDSDPKKEDVRKATAEKEDEIHQSLATAREALKKMDEEQYPLGKLRHLTEAHKSIVETLSQLFPSSSSADEILPTLIYTLITSPPEGINAVSNLNFIQRFRNSGKIDGEAAYCLVNLEAAISFLETVDLSSLRADESPEGPSKPSSQSSNTDMERPLSDPTKPADAQTSVSTITVLSQDTSGSSTNAAAALPSPKIVTTAPIRPSPPQRRISALMQAQADRIEASRDNILHAADKVYDSFNGTLENSLQFVFGRFKDQRFSTSMLPRTLEDARKLVSSPPPGALEEEILTYSGRSSPGPADDPLRNGGKLESKMVELVGGRRSLRDRSTDSTHSGGSSGSKRAGLAEVLGKDSTIGGNKSQDPVTSVAAGTPANLFTTINNTINPLNRFNVASLTRFGRAPSNSSSIAPTILPPTADKLNRPAESEDPSTSTKTTIIAPSHEKQPANSETTALSSLPSSEDLNVREALAELRRTKPPRKRFLEVQSASDLRIGEVEELLLEYRRLAKAIGEAIA